MESGKEIERRGHWLLGVSDMARAAGNDDLAENLKMAATALMRLSREVCAHGFICSGGEKCTSDHK